MDFVYIIFFIFLILIACVGVAMALRFCTFGGGHDSGYRKKRSCEKDKGDIVKDLRAAPRSKSEAAVIKIAEELLGCKLPTINPAWLLWEGKQLELDGYCAEDKIALEFSGPQHTKWYPEKESYIKYYQRITKDIVKRKLCKKRGVNLIVIDMTLPRTAWRDYLRARLHDWKPDVYEKPANYLVAQKAAPFRNEQIEREMRLESINIAKKL
jgi:hypothetical protein